MSKPKSAIVCEVCTQRVAHHGLEAGFIVGCRATGVKRLVHDRCKSKWDEQREEIMSGWRELCPDVRSTLPQHIQNRITHYLQAQGDPMPRGNRRAMVFPSQVAMIIRQRINAGDTRKGAIKRCLVDLQRDAPHLIPDGTVYTDFHKLWNRIYNEELEAKRLDDARREALAAVPTPPPVPQSPPDAVVDESSAPQIPVMPTHTTNVELEAMGDVAHALIKLAVVKQKRESLATIVAMLMDETITHTTTTSTGAS